MNGEPVPMGAVGAMGTVGVVGWRDYVEARLVGIEKAIAIAKDNSDHRLNSMNDLRGDRRRQSETFISRAEVTAIVTSIEKDLRVLRESKANLEGKASQLSVTIAMIVAFLGLVVGLIGIVRGI